MVCLSARGAALVFGLGALISAGGAAAQSLKPIDPAGDPVVAVVDGAPIHRSDVALVRRSLPAQFQEMPLEMLFPLLIDRIIDGKLIALAGRKENLQNDAEVKRRVAQFEDRVIQEVFINSRVDGRVTEAKLKERFEEHVKKNPPKQEIRARHILVRTESEAQKLIADLKRGEDFAKLAATHSIDPSGKQQGGDLGFFGKEEMVPEFSEAAFKLNDGETSAAPVKSQFGWHVIRVESRRNNSPDFEEMKETLSAELQQEAVSELIAKLREGAKIERFNLDGTPAPAAPLVPMPLQPVR